MTSTTTRPQGLTGPARWLGVVALVGGLALTGCTAGSGPTGTVAATVPVVTVTRTAAPATTPTTSRPAATKTTKTTTPSPTTTSTPDPSGIPWSQVGPGWSVIVTGTQPATSPDPGDGTLAMVSPEGRRYSLMGIGAYPRLQDVSPDGRRALGFAGLGSDAKLVEWDLQARTTHVVPVLSVSSTSARYTRPSGAQILVAGDQGARHRLLRLSRTGRVEASYETGRPTVPVSSSDGTRLLVLAPTGDALQVLDGTGTRVLRTVTPPSGYEQCVPVSAWSGAEVEIRCVVRGGVPSPSGPRSDVFALSTTTGSARALTHSPAESRDYMGYVVAWPVGDRVLGERGSGCGSGPVGLLDGKGVIGSELTWPGAAGQPPTMVGVVGTRAYAQVRTCESGGVRLVSQDVLTRRVTTLATAPVLDALVVPNR